MEELANHLAPLWSARSCLMNKRGGGTYELSSNAGSSDRGRGRYDFTSHV